MAEQKTILIADDDLGLVRALEISLRDRFRVLTATSVPQAILMAKTNSVDVGVFDLFFEGCQQDGLDLIDYFNREQPDVPLLVLSGDHSTRRVVEATRRRLLDFVPKGDGFKGLLDGGLARACEIRDSQRQVTSDFQTRSPLMMKALSEVDRILRAPGDHPILILGESGTGKEFMANFISARSNKRLIAANMAAIPKDTAESELFGHEKGAFTGAFANKSGLIEQAHRGIFFLDELGECDVGLQAKLLRAVQSKEIQPVGSPKTKKIDVRFIAATNCDVHAMVGAGTFRRDLLARLDTFTVQIPALRQRPEDIQFYAEMFLDQFAGKKMYQITADGLDFMLSYPWPANVRELRSAILRISILSDKRVIDKDALCKVLRPESTLSKTGIAHASVGQSSLENAVADVQRLNLLKALEQTKWNKTKAAGILGIHITTLHRWVKQFKITQAAS